ncbi:MAG: hypothetical protein JWO42_1372, partial [Chloroflexi bacterium]|nr:hypothetical protein [Chloroflexota bacterium]
MHRDIGADIPRGRVTDYETHIGGNVQQPGYSANSYLPSPGYAAGYYEPPTHSRDRMPRKPGQPSRESTHTDGVILEREATIGER